MIEGVLRLADLSIESIMVQRGDIVWLDSQAPLDGLWSKARASGHARFPVCDAQLEQLLGVISLADLGEAVRVGRLDRSQFIHPPLYVPPSVSVLKLLELFRDATVHLAVVTGEYGEVRGLATPMDILRAIAGELPEMGSRDAAKAVRREDGSWLFDGQVNIHEVERLLARDDLAHEEDYRTIGGLVLWHLGRLPVTGESLTWRELRFEVVDMDGPRIDKVLVAAGAARMHG
jgi:putative hemolysin